MRKQSLLFCLIVCLSLNLGAQTVSDLFVPKASLSRDYHKVAGRYQSLELNHSQLAVLRQQALPRLELQLPFEGRFVTLELERTSITTDDFSVIEALPVGKRRQVDFSRGVYYHGKIKGANSSFATISITDNDVAGIMADERGNIVLGSIENNGQATSEYALYRESDLLVPNPMKCFTEETPVDGVTASTGNPASKLTAVGEPVEVYFECDFKFYQDKGSNTTTVINYVLNFFNNTALLYANENIKVQVSQILVWTTTDPEAAANLTSTSSCLSSFAGRMASSTYIGDYAHFLSTRSLGGGIAYLLSNPCSSSRQFRCAVSAINNTYSNFPTYSWTVEVVTHEFGHNLGSNHTQWCGWTGGALDNCYTTEGGCAPGPQPTNGGTIMSYCHLVATGINFNNGFGQQPGDKIRAVVGASPCFGTCRMTIDVTKTDASCNQNNGSATVTAANGTGALSYSWSNGQTGATLTGVAPGTYHVRVSDAAGCQVMQVVTIGNSGTALNLSLTPNGTAGFCTGGSLVLAATNNAAYTYVWRKDGNVISGATSSSYTATTAGTYSVTATSGACSSTQTVTVSVVAAPTASISTGGATTFCSGGSVVLNGNAGGPYSYQWYNNSTLISGATSATYSATASGSYTVKVSGGVGCEATSSAISVTVNPSPQAIVTAASVTSFCAGNSVVLNASTGTGYTYQWYQNGNPLSGATQASYTASTSGNYTVMTMIGSCSRTSASTSVTVFPLPVITVNPAVSTIQKFQSQTLTATGAPLYNWSDLPDMISSTTTTGTYRPLTTTSYVVKGTDANGCKGSANVIINVIGCGDATDISTTPYSPSRVLVKWTNPPGATTDTLFYRKVGSTTWTKVFVNGNEYLLNGLTPGTDYEYEVMPLCTTTTVFIPSPVHTFKTDALTGGLFIRLYPNPVSANSWLEVITDKAYTLQVIIYDNGGKRVGEIGKKESVAAGQTIRAITPGALANGLYHVAVSIDGVTHPVKMVVQR